MEKFKIQVKIFIIAIAIARMSCNFSATDLEDVENMTEDLKAASASEETNSGDVKESIQNKLIKLKSQQTKLNTIIREESDVNPEEINTKIYPNISENCDEIKKAQLNYHGPKLNDLNDVWNRAFKNWESIERKLKKISDPDTQREYMMDIFKQKNDLKDDIQTSYFKIRKIFNDKYYKLKDRHQNLTLHNKCVENLSEDRTIVEDNGSDITTTLEPLTPTATDNPEIVKELIESIKLILIQLNENCTLIRDQKRKNYTKLDNRLVNNQSTENEKMFLEFDKENALADLNIEYKFCKAIRDDFIADYKLNMNRLNYLRQNMKNIEPGDSSYFEIEQQINNLNLDIIKLRNNISDETQNFYEPLKNKARNLKEEISPTIEQDTKQKLEKSIDEIKNSIEEFHRKIDDFIDKTPQQVRKTALKIEKTKLDENFYNAQDLFKRSFILESKQ